MNLNAQAHLDHRLQVERTVVNISDHKGVKVDPDGFLIITPTPTEATARFVNESGRTRLYCRDCDMYLNADWAW